MLKDRVGPNNEGELRVLDSRSFPASDAYSGIHDVVHSYSPQPWSFRYKAENRFKLRLESTDCGGGRIGRAYGVPLCWKRTRREIERSLEECFLANFVLSGTVVVEQGGVQNVATPGDLFILDSNRPVTMQWLDVGGKSFAHSVALTIPRQRFAALPEGDKRLSNLLVKKKEMIVPLYSALEHVANCLVSATNQEITALYNACVWLIPIVGGCYAGDRSEQDALGLASGRFQEVLAAVQVELSQPNLSPGYVAAKLGISERYVHKMFALRGTTFRAYVTSKRLDHIRAELGGQQRITDLAFTWGFTDLSTFNRAFRKRFGCAPRKYR